MKKFMMIMVLGALMAYLVPAQAQNNQEWQTSTMQTSGSAYSSQVTPIGAMTAPSQATTTDASYTPGRPGQPRRVVGDTNNEFDDGDEGSPIGDAVLPLLALACMYAVYSAVRRKRSARV